MPAGAGRVVVAGDVRKSWHEARFALEAREMSERASGAEQHPSGNGSGGGASREALATYRDLGSFQLLLSLQDSDALGLYCDSLLGPIENGEGHYGGELMRSLEAFIECNGQWEAAARRLYCHRHTLRYRIRKIEELTGATSVPRATGSSSGSRCAGARSCSRYAARSRDDAYRQGGSAVKVGVPTEIKTDEYRVALTPSGVRELSQHGHEVLVQRGAGEGSAIADDEYVAQGAAIAPDADAVFAQAEMIVKVKEPQPVEVARLRPGQLLFTYLHLAPDPELTRGLVDSGATCVAYETVEDVRAACRCSRR